jgi:type IV pilus modification protein PilV
VKRSTLSRQAGITLIEALIALLVMAFGMLALSGMQLSLSRNADVAKQRSEALRLAQRHMDKLRSFTAISTGTINWNGLASVAVDTQSSSNTTYTPEVSFGGATTDAMRPVTVKMSWPDRAGVTQSVTLASVISKSDPVDIGSIENPLPLNTPLKRPKNRNINIPIPAQDLGNGTSSYQFSSSYAIVFSNITGGVVQICNPGVSNATAAQILASSCVSITGYVVAGYVNYSGLTESSVWPGGTSTEGINTASITRNTASSDSITCNFGNATDQNTGATIADYKYYLCVIPLNTPYTWSGTVLLGGVSTTSNYFVCRYQYTQTSINSNERNVQPYSSVDTSMDEQNYKIFLSGNTGTPTDSDCTGMTVNDTLGASVSIGKLHQNCKSSNSAKAAACPASS